KNGAPGRGPPAQRRVGEEGLRHEGRLRGETDPKSRGRPVTDDDVRLHLLRALLAGGVAPSVGDTGAALDLSESEVAAAYDRLAANRVIVLRPGTRDVLMAAPLSAVPTPAVVRLPDGRSRYGNCIWDALGGLP